MEGPGPAGFALVWAERFQVRGGAAWRVGPGYGRGEVADDFIVGEIFFVADRVGQEGVAQEKAGGFEVGDGHFRAFRKVRLRR